MRLVFMGTPEFAVSSLEKLRESHHQIVAVVTAPDKPRGRGLKLTPTPVKETALKFGLPLMQPEKMKSPEFIESLKWLQPDLNVVVAFRILPEAVFSLPRLGSVNLHGSLLPDYRGAAPINWAIINGDNQTGVTTFLLKREVDAGDILKQCPVEISDEDDFGSLYNKMALAGADLLLETVNLLERGDCKPISQSQKSGRIAPKLTPQTGLIDWQLSAINIKNLIRGLSPNPGAFSHLADKKVIFLKVGVVENDSISPAGTIIKTDSKSGFVVSCGQDALHIAILKPEGKKAMSSAEYVRGYHVKNGDRFSSRR